MSARSGLGEVERGVLAAVAACGAGADAPHVPSTRVLEEVERALGLGARYAYPMLVDLAAPWRLHLPLIDGRGNWGSQHDDSWAEACYTELRLSRVGVLALAAEQGDVGPIPLGLIEGTLARDGAIPPFAPEAVLAALSAGVADDASAGPVVTPSGGTIEGDLAGLLAGEQVTLTLGCTILEEPGRLVITELPFGVTVETVHEHLQQWIAGRERAPILDVRDETNQRLGVRLVCPLTPGSTPDAARAWLRQVWPITRDVRWRLPAPMGERLRDWDRGDGSGLVALAALL